MQSDFLFKRNVSISRFLSGLRALAMKDITLDRLHEKVNAYVFKICPSADLAHGFLSACYDYAVSFRDFILHENNIRLYDSF